MSQEKAQLIAPIGIMTVSGMTATGVITATSFTGNVVGSAKSLVNGTDVTAGVVTGTSFVGNLTGNIQRLADSAPDISAGVTTATSFVGNLTGSVTDLTDSPAITVGLVTATGLTGTTLTGNVTGDVIGNVTGNVTGNVVGDVTGNVTGTISGNVTGNVTGNATGIAGGLGVNYNGGWTGAGTSQVRAGVVTATTFYGDGQYLEGVSSGPVSQQSIGITSAATTIDLSNGNVIFATQSADTTVSFANTSNGNVYFLRTKDDNSTARTITWPDSFKWDGGTAPTLLNNPRTTDAQVFLLITSTMGVTWYGKEVVNVDPQTFEIFMIGSNSRGSAGQNNEGSPYNVYSSPIQLGTNTNWSQNTDSYHTSGSIWGGVKTDGTLWSWGYNTYAGQLGLNDRTNRSSPTQVGTDTTWSALAINGENNLIASKTDGTLWSWGTDDIGVGARNSGPASSSRRSSPTQIPGTTWGFGTGKLGAGNYKCFNIKTDGTLWSWGYNGQGDLGVNDRTSRSSPVQVGTDTTWSQLNRSGGGNSTLCIKTDGTLWSWGEATKGRLGLNNDSVHRSSPTQIPGSWIECSCGLTHSGAIKDDNTLWLWGNNEYGTLGHNNQGNPTTVSSPKQLPGTWHSINCGREVTSATKTDGTAWAWGQNSGQLGHNNTTTYSSPVQIPGTSWERFTNGYEAAMLFRKAG